MALYRNKSLLLSSILIALVLSGLQLSRAAAADENVCASGRPEIAICGDGICDAYTGENRTSCAADCAPSSAVNTAPTSTPVTAVRPTATPNNPAAPTPTSTLVVVDIPDEDAEIAQSVTGELAVGCGFESYDSQSIMWQKAYSAMTRPRMIPLRADQAEVYVCAAPPTSKVCLPVTTGLLDAVNDNPNNVNLVQCDDTGKCMQLSSNPTVSADMLCYTLNAAEGITCETGCALAPGSLGAITLPLIGAISIETLTPALCIGLLLVTAFAGFLVIVTRRRTPKP